MHSLTRAALRALALTALSAPVAVAQAASLPMPAAAPPAAAPAPTSGTRIAYVNSQRLLSQTPAVAEAQARIETELEGVKAQEQRMSDSLAMLVQAYQKAKPTLTEAQQAQRELALRNKQTEYQQRAQQLEQRAQAHQADYMQPIQDQIRGIIEGLRVEGGYAVILDAGSQSGVVVAIDTTLDLTDKVLAKLADAGPPKAGAKPAAKPSVSNKPTGVSRPPTPRGR